MSHLSQSTSSNNGKHPYLVDSKYESLFGHLLKPDSSPEWRERFERERAIAKAGAMALGDGIQLAKM